VSTKEVAQSIEGKGRGRGRPTNASEEQKMGWTAREKDGQQKDISVKESPKGPPDLGRVAQATAARGGMLDEFPSPQSRLC
jgi:hypothetical protein